MKVTMEEEAFEEGSPDFPFQIRTQEQKWENLDRTMLAVAALNCNAPESESSNRNSLDHEAQSMPLLFLQKKCSIAFCRRTPSYT